MKRFLLLTTHSLRNDRFSTDSLAKIGALALVVFMVAMALMPLTSTGALASNDDKTPNVQNLQIQPKGDTPADDPSPEPTQTPTPIEYQVVNPQQVQVDDPPVLDLPADPTPEGTPVYQLIAIYINKHGCPQGFD
jgi:hypothetical protein